MDSKREKEDVYHERRKSLQPYSLSSAEIKKLDKGLFQIHARRWIKSAKKFTRLWSEYIIPSYIEVTEKDMQNLKR